MKPGSDDLRSQIEVIMKFSTCDWSLWLSIFAALIWPCLLFLFPALEKVPKVQSSKGPFLLNNNEMKDSIVFK